MLSTQLNHCISKRSDATEVIAPPNEWIFMKMTLLLWLRYSIIVISLDCTTELASGIIWNVKPNAIPLPKPRKYEKYFNCENQPSQK